MRAVYDEKLSFLHKNLIEMGGYIEHSINNTIKALVKQDVALARECVFYDDTIDAKEKYIEKLCMELILLQQPVAGDLRIISSAMKMITDMERIGDQSSDIAEISITLAKSAYIKKLDHIPKMAEVTVGMVKDAIDAYVSGDLKLAANVIERDDIVDAYFISVRNDLVDLIIKDTDNCDQALSLMMIAKYFERIGDHAVNIAEWAVFSLTGKHYCDKLQATAELDHKSKA